MYKLKYYSLKKEEKEKLKKDFDNTEFGIRTNTRLKRILVVGLRLSVSSKTRTSSLSKTFFIFPKSLFSFL